MANSQQIAQKELETVLLEGIQSSESTVMTQEDWLEIRAEAFKQYQKRRLPQLGQVSPEQSNPTEREPLMRRAIPVCILVALSNGCSRTHQPAPTVRESSGAPSQDKHLIKPARRDCDFASRSHLRVSDWLSHGDVVLKRVEPAYPSEAKRRRLSGRVSVRILVNSEGKVDQVCGIGGHPILREAAESAAAQWRFRVPELNGKRLPYVEGNLNFDFRSTD